MVHKECLDLPRVIRISRHEHRISWAPSLPLATEQWVCRSCHIGVDGRYRAFSSTKDCGYVAHSLCATSKDVWDREELEGVPEEELEDIEPFEVIGEGLIRHFSHDHHHLRSFTTAEERLIAWDAINRCQACLLPICSSDCGFYLHEECANLPRKKRYVCHKESFTRDHVDLRLPSTFEDAFPHFIMDVRCAPIFEPLNHKGHDHPLFFNSRQGYNAITCGACRKKPYFVLKCFFRWDTEECGFHLCYKCATLPDTARYKFDRHLLTLCCGEEASGAKSVRRRWIRHHGSTHKRSAFMQIVYWEATRMPRQVDALKLIMMRSLILSPTA
ncbi:PREDICTED: uncharacterized protein LOC104820445 [Tarenaya hassleriana]|uniref:uncharacterized protein LOC104820445 n=1 Tax=Tarenaya hassleriana TaxID=28532 RepID=UPI00053C8CA9|nr:PREDICTED: uncharacterized protein LOC104820445 [Tarenaya hassleriana]